MCTIPSDIRLSRLSLTALRRIHCSSVGRTGVALAVHHKNALHYALPTPDLLPSICATLQHTAFAKKTATVDLCRRAHSFKED